MDKLERVFREASAEYLDLDALIDAIGTELFHYARVVTGSQAGAEDAVQDLFVALLEQRPSLSKVQRPKTWLFIVLRNISRRSRKASPVDLADSISESVETDPTQRLILKEAVQTLDPKQQEIVLLHTWEGLTFTEIAEVLSIPRGTALSHYHRAMSQLRKVFKPSPEICTTKESEHA